MMQQASTHHPAFSRAGYSFPEVLFAVVVLGIGFIMIAAIFPVAIQQSKATSDESTAASLGQAAVGTLSRVGADQYADTDNNPSTPPVLVKVVMPATGTAGDLRGKVHAFDTTDGWEAIRGNMINGDDPRYAFVPLYRRDGNPLVPSTVSSTAQIYVIATQIRGSFRPAIGGTTIPARTSQVYDQYDVMRTDPSGTPLVNPNNLVPRRVKILKMTDNPNGDNVDILEIDINPIKLDEPNQNVPAAVAEGCYLITVNGGRIYRVGTRRTDLDDPVKTQVWELQPGSDLSDATENITAVEEAFVVGRERVYAPSPANDTFVGPAQDIAIYTTIIPVTP